MLPIMPQMEKKKRDTKRVRGRVMGLDSSSEAELPALCGMVIPNFDSMDGGKGGGGGGGRS